MKNNTTKIIIAIVVGFLSGYFVHQYFFKPSKPVQIDEKRIKNLPDSSFVDEFEKRFGSKR